MITTKRGITEFKGDYPEIMADYMSITTSMFEYLVDKEEMDKDEANERLKKAFEGAYEDYLSIEKIMEDNLNVLSDIIGNILNKVIAATKEGDNNGSK